MRNIMLKHSILTDLYVHVGKLKRNFKIYEIDKTPDAFGPIIS